MTLFRTLGPPCFYWSGVYKATCRAAVNGRVQWDWVLSFKERSASEHFRRRPPRFSRAMSAQPLIIIPKKIRKGKIHCCPPSRKRYSNEDVAPCAEGHPLFSVVPLLRVLLRIKLTRKLGLNTWAKSSFMFCSGRFLASSHLCPITCEWLEVGIVFGACCWKSFTVAILTGEWGYVPTAKLRVANISAWYKRKRNNIHKFIYDFQNKWTFP